MKSIWFFVVCLLLFISPMLLNAGDRFGQQWDQEERSGQQVVKPSTDIDVVDISEKTMVFGPFSSTVGGVGDMSQSTYDPQGIGADAFLLSNHTGVLTSLSVLSDVAFSGDTTVFADYSVINNRYIVFGHTSTIAFPVNLDNTSNYDLGQQIRLSKIDSSINAMTINPASGETIAGESSIIFAAKGDALTLHNDGSADWKVLQRAVAVEAGSALLHVDNENGIFYNLSTVFQAFTSFDSTLTSTTVEASLSEQTIIINAAGRYDVFSHIIGESLSGTLVEIASFLNLVTEIDEAGAVIPAGAEHFPSFLNISTGSIVSGAITDLEAADGDTLILAEVNGVTPGAVYTFIFDNVIAPDKFHWIESSYNGSSGHDTKVQALNIVLGTYTALTANADDLPHTGATLADVYSRDFEFPDPKIDYVNASGQVFARVEHVSTGSPGDQYIMDKILVSDAFSTASMSTATFVDLDAGDRVSLMIKDGLRGLFKIRHAGIKVHKIGD